MEDNQVIANNDPLKDLYNEFNPKLNLAKSYDEFKSTMQDSASRKAFFDEFNPKLNLANDFNQFENVLGLKKKDGTIISGPTKLPSTSQGSNLPDFAKGQAIAEKGFAMPEATPTPEQKPEGSYANTLQNLRQKTVEKASDIDAASLEFLRNLSGKLPFANKPEKIYDQGQLTEYGKNIPASDFLGRAIRGINNVKEQEQALQQTTGKLPETLGGEVVGGITGILPDLALTAMTGGKNLFSGTGKLAAIGNALTGAFVREQAISGAAKGYGEAEKKGASAAETLGTTLKESGKSAGQGALYELAGFGGGKLGNVLSGSLKNATAKEAVNLGARLATFSLGVPTVESAISEGRLPNSEEILKNLGIAGTLEAFHLGVNKINNLRAGSAVNNFIKAPPEVISDLVNSDESATYINLTAMDAVKRGDESTNPEEKAKLYKTASDLTQAADIKHVTDVIANSSDGLQHIANDLPEDIRDQFMQKAQDIHQSLNPTELQKQAHAADISAAEEVIKQNEQLAKPENPNVLERVQAQRKLDEANKIIEESSKNLNKVLDNQEKQKQQIQEAKLAELEKPNFSNKSIEELEKRQAQIENAKSGTPEYKEYVHIDNELQNREWRSVFDVPLDKVSEVVDNIMKKDKEMPYGFGSYMDLKDARLTKEIADKYSTENISKLSDREIIKDFKDAMFGNPMDWYSDGLKLRESIKEAKERGIDTFGELSKEFIRDGYNREDAIEMAKRKLEPLLKSLKTKENAIQEPSTEGVLQYPQEGVGEPGSERQRVEPSIEGAKIAQEGKQVKGYEEEKIAPNVENRQFTTSKKHTIDFEDGNLIVRDKKGEPLSERASKKALQEYADNFDYSKGEKAPEVPSDIANNRDAAKYVIEESNNPEEIAQIYANEDLIPKESNAKFQAIKEYGLGRIKTSSYTKRFGDINKVEKSMYLKIFSEEKGLPIDVLAKSISDKYEGINIEPKDIVDYIEKYSRGDKAVLEYEESNIAKQAVDKFNKLTGLDLTPELANKILDKELEKATKDELDIIKEDYENAKQLEDAYWAADKETNGFTKEAPIGEVNEPKVTKEEVKEPVSENEFLYTGTDEQRKKALLKNLMKSDIPEDYKKGLEEKGLTYKVSNQVEASEAAKAIIGSLGVNDALEIARSEKIDPSVGSAIYAESLNNLWSNERKLKAEGKSEEAKALAKQWSDITMEYADKLNSKGKWTAQTAYFYKTSPMGFAIRIENERIEQFANWFEAKEKDYKKVFNEILQSEEGQTLLKQEVEKITKAERAKERQKRDKSIDDFFEKLKLKGGTYATIIPPNVWNAAVDIMKVSVKAGDRIVVAVQSAIDHIDKELNGAEWDKEKFRNDYESQLNKVTGESVKEKDNEKVLLKRISELKRRLEENDFSAEEYKAKRTLSEKEQLAKDEYDKVKKLYDEAKKESPEYIDKKAKQYLDKLRKRLKGISEEQKEDIIRRSIKEIVNKGGLEYEDFKDIVSESIGIKKITDDQKAEIEKLTEQSNIADELEQKFLDNPTRENIDAFKAAKAKSLEADRKLFEMTSQKADIVGTLKSLITLNYLGVSTLVKNFAQNVVYQGTVRFPISLAKKGIDQSVYGATYMGNKMFGTKVIKPSISLTDAQRGYFKEYREGVIRGWEQMIKGVDEKDYFSKNQYASSLNPSKSAKELKASMKGELFLTPKQKIDKWIQATLGWQPYAISRGMIYGDKPPRYAAQGAEALQIGHKELGITDPLELEAFMISPEKYAYKHLVEKAGLSSSEAATESKSIAKRIVDAGAVATFQNENYFNDFFSKIDEWARVSKEDKWTAKVIKPPVALLKASQLPFLKTPANIAWAYFKIANPALTMTKSLVEAGLAQNALRKGDFIGYKEYSKSSKESFGMASIGIAITAGAAALAAKGLIRTSIQQEDKAREKAGEGFFGKSNELNMGALLGGDDYWVDLSWFGPVGTIIDMRGRMMEDNKQKELRGEKIDDGVMNEIVNTMGYSVSSTLNTLVFDQGAKIVDALSKGSQALNQVIVNNANALGNIVLGGTIPAINKALAPEKADLAADNLIDQIINNQKQKNVFVTWAAGYPPSKVSIWGDPITQDKSVSGVLGSMLGWEKGSNDKFGAILYNEQRRTGNNDFFPPVEDRKIKVNGKDVKITIEEKRDLDTYIGQARKNMVSPFLNDKSTYRILLGNGKYGDFSYSELTAGKNKDGQTITPEQADNAKLDALDVIYENGKKAGFAKFKDKYKQYQDASLNIEKIKKEAYRQAGKQIFESKLPSTP